MDRDPRDVIVSLYFQVKGRMRDVFQYEGDISAFIRDDYFGIENLCVYQRQWRRLCQEGAALRVTYEECHDDFGKVMRKIVDWYGFEVSDAALARARDESTFEKMRLVELAGTFCEPWLRPRNGELKVRRGIVGGYRDVLSPADLSVVDEARRRHDLV